MDDVYVRLYNLLQRGYGNTFVFTNEDDYTHAFILNVAMPNLCIPAQNVIGMAFEPIKYLGLTKKFVEYAKKHIGKYYIGDVRNLPTPPFYEHYSYMWHIQIPNWELNAQKVSEKQKISEKQHLMSIVVSNKTDAVGHKYRHALVKEILKTDLPIDIFGNGCGKYLSPLPQYQNNQIVQATPKQQQPPKIKDIRIKGKFVETEPYLQYKFHICIENCKLPHYFSEKITNTLLCGTIPIYWGCTNINTYFPNMVICLTGNLESDLFLISHIVKNPEKYEKHIDIDKVKEKLDIMNVINEWVAK